MVRDIFMHGIGAVLARYGSVVTVMVTSILVAAGPVHAQTSSPEIIAKERRDPAAGEVVIINPGKPDGKPAASAKPRVSNGNDTATGRKADAADPYAPIKRNSLPKNYKSRSAASEPAAGPVPQSKPAVRQAPATPPDRSEAGTRRAAEEPAAGTPPPLPGVNMDAAARQRYLTRAPRADEGDADRSIASRSGPAQWDQDAWDRDRRYRRRADVPSRPYVGEREIVRERRPWRLCRRWAWRCEDGFEDACYRWQRNCS
ncbi:MAG: hypothetical protein KKB37_07525 [Alphaproteobacteria bacterium]|nr:hypothetical protein [Alphaproteobacteria bacterium]